MKTNKVLGMCAAGMTALSGAANAAWLKFSATVYDTNNNAGLFCVWLDDATNTSGNASQLFDISSAYARLDYNNTVVHTGAVGSMTINKPLSGDPDPFFAAGSSVPQGLFTWFLQPPAGWSDTTTFQGFLNAMVNPSSKIFVETAPNTGVYLESNGGFTMTQEAPPIIPTPGTAALALLGAILAPRRRREGMGLN